MHQACRCSRMPYHRVLKVARTLADLEASETVGRIHLAEANLLPDELGADDAGGVM